MNVLSFIDSQFLKEVLHFIIVYLEFLIDPYSSEKILEIILYTI